MGSDISILEQDEVFRYRLLGRLKSDCEYYLGFGCRSTTRLWAGSEVEQIKTMRELYNSFEDTKKPEWLTMEQILDYENKMVGTPISLNIGDVQFINTDKL